MPPALLGSGRFKALLKHLRVHFPSLLAAAHQHQLSPVTTEAHRQDCTVEGNESLQCDELVAEIEQRVTRLEKVLNRYNSSSSLGSRVSELHSGALRNTSLSSSPLPRNTSQEPRFDEAYVDEKSAGDYQVHRKAKASHLLTTRIKGEQDKANDTAPIKWASLPHHSLWEILKQLRWERKSSGAFRSVCKWWREAHDSLVPSLKLVVPPLMPPPLPYRLETKTGFTGVTALDLSDNYGIPAALISAQGSLSGLRSLNLARNKLEGSSWANLGPTLTGLTYLSMARIKVNHRQLESLAPFLSSLTDFDLSECFISLSLPHRPPSHPTFLASLTALTRLDLRSSNVTDKGMDSVALLTALTRLDICRTAVSHQGLDLLAPLAACLTHLSLSGHAYTRHVHGDLYYGDAEMVSVSALRNLTRLEMLNCQHGAGISQEGLGAVSSLTCLVHLELDLRYFDNSDEGWRSFSSLTALSHLRLLLSSFSDEGENTLASFTALTHLVLGDETEIYYTSPPEFDMSDVGAFELVLDGINMKISSGDDASLSDGYYGGDYDLDSFDSSEEDSTEEDDAEEDDAEEDDAEEDDGV